MAWRSTTVNRTIAELKFDIVINIRFAPRAVNRTMAELKFIDGSYFLIIPGAVNRTITELKYAKTDWVNMLIIDC